MKLFSQKGNENGTAKMFTDSHENLRVACVISPVISISIEISAIRLRMIFI